MVGMELLVKEVNVLKKLSEFVLSQLEFKNSEHYEYSSSDNDRALDAINDYTKLIKRPLLQGMFIGENKIFKGFYVSSHISLVGLKVTEIVTDFNHKKLVIFRHTEGSNTICYYKDLEELIELGVILNTINPLF